jgi:alpha/beta hydrolase family protein
MTNEAPTAAWVLVHSPLVGPATLAPLAQALRRRGRHAVAPSLLGPATADWRQTVERLAAALDASRPIVLVAHSGAGYLVPAMADAITADVVTFVFVDAPIPPTQTSTPLVPAELRPELEALARDGVLPPWSQWFGEGVMEAMIPDAAQRDAIERELPHLPLSYFDAEVPVRGGWDRTPCAYLLLSPEQYGAAASDAEGRGWATAVLENADHLSTATRSDDVADVLLDLYVNALNS